MALQGPLKASYNSLKGLQKGNKYHKKLPQGPQGLLIIASGASYNGLKGLKGFL